MKHSIVGTRADLAIVPDYAGSRAYARALEARERAEALRTCRPAIIRLLAHVAPSVMARLDRRA